MFTIMIIFSDNYFLFHFLKTKSNHIKERISSIEFLKNLSSTVIRDIDYRKPEDKKNNKCLEDKKIKQEIINLIGEKRYQEQKLFLDHYRNNGSVLSNTIILADLVNEFMGSMVDTLFLPFVGSTQYCYNIMDTEWCQHESIDLFVFPIKVSLFDYNPKLSVKDYRHLKKLTKVTVCGSEEVYINLVFEKKADLSQPYYLYIFNNEAFVTLGELTWPE